MTVRERMEQEEYDVLAPHAQKAAESQGRLYPEEDNDVRTCYQRDADRILHSKSFRRLMHKTQVFLSPEGDHYRTCASGEHQITAFQKIHANATRNLKFPFILTL